MAEENLKNSQDTSSFLFEANANSNQDKLAAKDQENEKDPKEKGLSDKIHDQIKNSQSEEDSKRIICIKIIIKNSDIKKAGPNSEIKAEKVTVFADGREVKEDIEIKSDDLEDLLGDKEKSENKGLFDSLKEVAEGLKGKVSDAGDVNKDESKKSGVSSEIPNEENKDKGR